MTEATTGAPTRTGGHPGLLIASPQLRDPNFAKTVVLMCQHDEDGALGIIINRGGQVSIGAVTEQLALAQPSSADDATWWGGPVGQGTGFVIWKGSAPDDEGWNPGGGVAVSASVEQLEQLVDADAEFHLALGYAGWGPGQLDTEIEEGSWLYVDVDPAIVFEAPMNERWPRALAMLGLRPDLVWMPPAEA